MKETQDGVTGPYVCVRNVVVDMVVSTHQITVSIVTLSYNSNLTKIGV